MRIEVHAGGATDHRCINGAWARHAVERPALAWAINAIGAGRLTPIGPDALAQRLKTMSRAERARQTAGEPRPARALAQ